MVNLMKTCPGYILLQNQYYSYENEAHSNPNSHYNNVVCIIYVIFIYLFFLNQQNEGRYFYNNYINFQW